MQLAVYKGDLLNPEQDVINKSSLIPKQITAFQKYAFRAKPNKTGGTTWTNIKILHDADIQEILAETKDECHDVNFGVYLQNIQHFDVQVAGWLMHMHDSVDLDFWQTFFDEELEKKRYPKGSIGLTLRKPLDGKFSKEKKASDISITRAVHVETIGTKGEMIKKEIKAILKSQTFKTHYIPEVKLIPPFNSRNQTRQIQLKIQQCILIQDQFCSQVTVGDLDLVSVDSKVSCQSNATLRELILQFKNKDDKFLFVGVERKWNNQGYSVLYPKVYMEEAMEIIKHLPFYLVRKYGGGSSKNILGPRHSILLRLRHGMKKNKGPCLKKMQN